MLPKQTKFYLLTDTIKFTNPLQKKWYIIELHMEPLNLFSLYANKIVSRITKLYLLTEAK